MMDDTGNGELIRTHKSHRTYGPAFGLHLHSRLNRMNIPRSDIWLIHRHALRCINMMMNDTCHYITTILFIQPVILLEYVLSNAFLSTAVPSPSLASPTPMQRPPLQSFAQYAAPRSLLDLQSADFDRRLHPPHKPMPLPIVSKFPADQFQDGRGFAKRLARS